jgi:cyclopropane fatty-acyl-phospholipid synthase-like methyltransferase
VGNRSKIWDAGYERFAKQISAFIPNSTHSTILELGCGRGQLTLPLASKFKGKIIAIDSSKEDVRTLKNVVKMAEFKHSVIVEVAKAENIHHLPNLRFQGVVANFFIGWIKVKLAREILEKVHNMLTDKGIVIISDFFSSATNKAQGIVIEQGMQNNNLFPSEKWWKPEEVALVLEESGFKELTIYYFDWNIKFGYQHAVDQLKSWCAKPEFIREKKEDLREHGLELPTSFIVTARKTG